MSDLQQVELKLARHQLSMALDFNADCHGEDIRLVLAALTAAEAERDAARAYLSRLLVRHAPGVEPLPDLGGACSQIDNLLMGARQTDLRDALSDLVARLAMARPLSIGSIDSHRDARYSTAELKELIKMVGGVRESDAVDTSSDVALRRISERGRP